MKVDRNFRNNLYKNNSDNLSEALQTYNGILKGYLLTHTAGTIAVFKHRRRNQDIIVWNVIKPWDEGHSHFKNVQVARIIADNIALQRKPSSKTCLRNLASYPRIADSDYKYAEWVKDLMNVKIDKKLGNNNYINVSRAM